MSDFEDALKKTATDPTTNRDRFRGFLRGLSELLDVLSELDTSDSDSVDTTDD